MILLEATSMKRFLSILVLTAITLVPLSGEETSLEVSELDILKLKEENIDKQIIDRRKQLNWVGARETEFLVNPKSYGIVAGIGVPLIYYDYALNSEGATGETGNKFPTILSYISGGIMAGALTGFIIDELIVEPMKRTKKRRKISRLNSELTTLRQQEKEVQDQILPLEYSHAREKDTIEAYAAFLENYPDSQYEEEVYKRLYAIYELKDTIKAYKEYVNNYPENNSHKKEAIEKIYHHYRNRDTLSAYKEFITQYSNSAFTDKARKRANAIYQDKLTQDYRHIKKVAPESFWNSYPMVRRGVLDFREVTLKELLLSGELQEGIDMNLKKTGDQSYELVLDYHQEGMEEGKVIVSFRKIGESQVIIENMVVGIYGKSREYIENWQDKLTSFSMIVGRGLHKPKPNFLKAESQ